MDIVWKSMIFDLRNNQRVKNGIESCPSCRITLRKRNRTRQRHKQYQGVVTRSMIRSEIHLWTKTKQRDNYRSKKRADERRNLVAKTVSVTIRQTHSLIAIMILHDWNTNEASFFLTRVDFFFFFCSTQESWVCLCLRRGWHFTCIRWSNHH